MDKNPLKQIFKLNSKGECTSQMISTSLISKFFDIFDNNPKDKESLLTCEEKTKIITNFYEIIKENRTIIEYFSSCNNKSIYIYLFELYLDKNSSEELKNSIIMLLNELRINIQTNKEVYLYLFNHLSLIYKGKEGEENFTNILNLLKILLGETENYVNPRNYFACNGNCKIILNSENKNLRLGYCLTFILNFKTNINPNEEKAKITLLKIKFNNKSTLKIYLKYPDAIMIKDKIVETLPQNKWINLIINIINKKDGIKLYFFVNGESKIKEEKYEGLTLKSTDKINTMEFFENFYGEITSFTLLSQKEEGDPGVHTEKFLSLFASNSEGIWKKKIFENFLDNMSSIDSIDFKNIQENIIQEDLISVKKDLKNYKNDLDNISSSINYKKELKKIKKQLDKKKKIKDTNELSLSSKDLNNSRTRTLSHFYTVRENFMVSHKKLRDDIVFILSPFNYYDACPNIIEDCLGQFNDAFYYGDIRHHKYNCFQNKINYVCSLTNLFPIAEMFLIHPKLLTEINFEIFLKIIDNILNFRKNNIESTTYCKFFKVLCIFLEKYPNSLYTEKILDSFANIGKTMFRNNSEALCKTFFKHILLNEKILSKYNSNLQIKFWNYIKLFCESDSSQIEKFINMNIISLLLRFYDRNKYKEMCCKEHLEMFKEEYIKNKTIMDPPLNKKLSYITDVLKVIIYSQEPKNCFYLFKLLTLDLSPCLTKFIINIFNNSLKGEQRDNEWKTNFIIELIKNKYEIILINTFIHSLPDVRIEIIELMYQIHLKGVSQKQIDIHELMFKPFLLPSQIFYINSNTINEKENNNNETKIDNSDNNTNNNNDKNKTDTEEEKIKCENSIAVKNDTKTQEIEGILVIKEEIYTNYINQLFSYFLLWSLHITINIPYITINLQKSKIKDINIIQHIFEINTKIKDINFMNKLINSLELLMDLEDNCLKALYNKKIFSYILDLAFYCYNEKRKNINKDFEHYYLQCKNIIIKLYINSLLYASTREIKDIKKNPSVKLETIYVWGDKLLLNEKETEKIEQNLIISFLNEILFELLNNFKKNYDNKINLKLTDKNNIINEFFYNNYIIFISQLYHYCFQYRLDIEIYKFGLDDIVSQNKNEIILPPLFMYSMQIDNNLGQKIEDSWFNFRFIEEIYNRMKFIWGNNNFYKIYLKGKKKAKNKFKKYEEILQNIILNKSEKNAYKKELEILFHYCYVDKNVEIISPVVKIIQIFMMCIISLYISKNEGKELLKWLKEFKQLLRFIIVSSSNLTMKDQVEFYEKIQESALNSITIGICFLKKCLVLTKTCKDKIEKMIINIIMFCLFIQKFHINYFNSHKKKRIFGSTKYNRNDLSHCAVVNLFNKYIVDKNEEVIFNLEFIEKIITEKHYYDKIRTLINGSNSVLDLGLLKNKKLITILNEKYFRLFSYKLIVDSRIEEIKELKDNSIYNLSHQILEMLPLYEKELAKYSNNSLEKNLNKKNLYRKIKKHLFSWNGYWSDKSIFYDEDIENEDDKKDENKNKENENKIIEDKENKNKEINFIKNVGVKTKKNILKYKLLNHYTKSFMKPLLVPIFDMSYYLPNFTGFDSEKLFNEKNNQIINLDIDQILKLNDSQNSLDNVLNSKDSKENNLDTTIKINELNDEKKEENYLRELYIKSNPELAEKLLKISNNLDFGKEEEEYIEEKAGTGTIRPLNQSKEYFLSCLVKTSHHIKGVCFTDENQLNFKVFFNQQTGKSMNGINLAFTENDEDYDPERKTCYGSYFMFHHKDKNLYKISIKYNEIKWIFRRRYYYKDSALEIFTDKNKSFYFNFKYEKEREIALDNILKLSNSFNRIVIDLKEHKDNFDNVIGFQYNNVMIAKRKTILKKKVLLSEKIENWKKWKMSNFEFLMWLNIISNRSYNDLSQYPIFPWILTNYDDPLKKDIEQNEINTKNIEQIELKDYSYRDLSSPIGMLGIGEEGEKRKENFLMTYDELKNENEFQGQKPYFYGSNYSNPIYTCNFMIRLFPFTHISIELQGNKIDDSNRLFFSIKNTFYGSMSHKTDVRELIPEFYYLPEMLLNINDINLGIKEDGDKINDVATPCNDDPYKFVEAMKRAFENNKVSYSLQNWIDLIFGNKARGKEAENAKNVFTEASYQENINLNKIEDKSSLLRTVEFGLIPNQIMTKECPKREKKDDAKKKKEITDINCKLKIYKCKNKEGENTNPENNINPIIKKGNIPHGPILKTRVYNNEKLITFSVDLLAEKKINYSSFDKSFSEEKQIYHKVKCNQNRMRYYYENNKSRQDKNIIICNNGKTIILGGFYDGSIKYLNFERNIFTKKYPFKLEEPILALAIDEEEKYLFVGNSLGNIIIYQINFISDDWEIILNNTDQLSEISHINVNNELNLWSSSTNNGFINLYTIPSFKLVRSIKTRATKLEYAFLSTSSLPSILVIDTYHKYTEIYSYSINGTFLKYEKEEDTLLSPIIIKDSNFNEYIVYICENKNNITIRNLPFLNIQTIINNMGNISCICISEDIKLLYAVSNKDEQLYVVKDDPKQISQN